MKKLFLISLFLLVTGCVFAQNVSITGLVRDKVNNQPIEYANITLYHAADSALVNGTVTTPDGRFKIKALKAGSYFIKVRFIGYANSFVKSVDTY